jgi:hypothetical protein
MTLTAVSGPLWGALWLSLKAVPSGMICWCSLWCDYRIGRLMLPCVKVTSAGDLDRRPKPHTYRATALSVATLLYSH